MDTESKIAIACNIAEPTKECVKGALAFVINLNFGNGGESVQVYARSRGGRWIRKWERLDRLCNFRVKTIPPEHPRYSADDIFIYRSGGKEELAGWAKIYTGMSESRRNHRSAGHLGSWDNCGECRPKEKTNP